MVTRHSITLATDYYSNTIQQKKDSTVKGKIVQFLNRQ